jgi:hypothetical protein
MKNLLLFFFIITFTVKVYGQIRIGSTEQEIREEFGNKILSTHYEDNGSKIIHYKSEFTHTSFCIGTNGICHTVLMVPDNDGNLHGMIEYNNKNYVVVDDKRWKWYSSIGIIHIKLNLTESNLWIFVYSLKEY